MRGVRRIEGEARSAMRGVVGPLSYQTVERGLGGTAMTGLGLGQSSIDSAHHCSLQPRQLVDGVLLVRFII